MGTTRRCRRCKRDITACPDPACEYHHSDREGVFVYPPDCKEDLKRSDLEEGQPRHRTGDEEFR